MDEKPQRESLTSTTSEGPAGEEINPADKTDQNSKSLKNVTDEIESKDLNEKALGWNADFNNDPVIVPAETDKTASDMLTKETVDEYTKEKCLAHDERKGTSEAQTETRSEFNDDAEFENIQVVAAGKAAAAKTDELKITAENAAADGQSEFQSGDPDDSVDQEFNLDLLQAKSPQSSHEKRSVLKIAGSAVAIVLLFWSVFIFNGKSKNQPDAGATKTAENKTIFQKQEKRPLKGSKPPVAEADRIFSAKLQEIGALRDTLLNKQAEVQRLKAQYQDGIEELENEISDKLHEGEISTFGQAMEDESTAFSLRTIQRRQAYIQQLERPLEWIFSACEELLYIKRRVVLDIQIAEIASGIDMNKHIEHINSAIQKYQPTPDRLALDMTRAKPEPLEMIWNRIVADTRLHPLILVHSRDQILSRQICSGNFEHLNEISKVSPETAECLTRMQGSDLFLNGLSEISPGAARRLFQWKGSWVCLNGVRALSPRVADYLFQWDGSWISLNGLTEFPVEIGERLLQWEGKQLELMGLQYNEDFSERIAVKFLAQWERAGGKLFVTQSVRKKIDEMNKEST